MKSAIVIALGLVACTSTRQLASVADLRLRTPDHHAGFIVRTTEPWRERVDPNTRLRFHSATAGWTDRLTGGDLYVDAGGAWIDGQVALSELADAVRISGLTPEAEAQLAATRPTGARLERDGDGWLASGQLLRGWLGEFEKAVARLDPASASVVVCSGPCITATTRRQLTGDDALIYSLRIVHSGEPLGTWRVYSKRQGWLPPVHGVALIDLLEAGRATKVGWQWSDIDQIEVENISGGKTLGAMIGTAALAIVLAPAALVLHGASPRLGNAGDVASHGIGGGGGGADPAGSWTPELATAGSLDAHRMFTIGSRVRAIVRPTLALDTTFARRGQMIGTGLIARLRFGDIFEIGGGVRFVEMHDPMAMRSDLSLAETGDSTGWSHATTGVFHVGVHLPLDAGFRIAIPVGFEASAGGAVEHDVRVPWGLRYTSASGRWFGTVYPVTPSHARLATEIHGRWSFATGGELGVSF